MPEPVAPRTLLEAVVRQRQLSWDEAADLVVKTARQHEDVSLGIWAALPVVNDRGAAPTRLPAGRCSTRSANRLISYWPPSLPVISLFKQNQNAARNLRRY